MSGVSVYIRISPFRPIDPTDSNILDSQFLHHQCLRIINPRPSSSENHRVQQYDISKIKQVFESQATNRQIYQEIIQKHLFSTLNTIFMVYGQTGSGKTHTLLGPLSQGRFTGVFPLTLEYLVAQKASIQVSAIQIYNNKVYDLQYPNLLRPLQTYQCGEQMLFRENPLETTIYQQKDVHQWLQTIKKNQVIGTTTLNDQSSRSHTIFFVKYRREDGVVYRFTAVDLAGNEKARYSTINNKKDKLESIHINKSLFALKECIRAAKAKQNHIPYRRSLLTMFLKNFLVYNSQILFLTTIHPSKKCYHDIVNSIEYSMYLIESNIHKTVQKINTITALKHPKQAEKTKNHKCPKSQRKHDILPAILKRPERPNTPNLHQRKHSHRPSHLRHRRLVSNKLPSISLTTDYECRTLLKIYFNYIMNVYEIARVDQKIYHKMNRNRLVDKNELLARIQQKKEMLEKFQKAIIEESIEASQSPLSPVD